MNLIHKKKCRNDFAKTFDFTERISENLSMITCIDLTTICKDFLSRTMNQDQRNKKKLSITKGPIGLAKCYVLQENNEDVSVVGDWPGFYRYNVPTVVEQGGVITLLSGVTRELGLTVSFEEAKDMLRSITAKKLFKRFKQKWTCSTRWRQKL